MRKSHWLWLPLLGVIAYLAGQFRATDARSAVALEIHAPFDLAAPDAPALAEMLYGKSPEMRGQITITPAGEPNHFEIASDDPDAETALALANSAAASLEDLIGEHFRTRLDERLGTLKVEIEAQKQKVEESRRKMLELLEKHEAEDAGAFGEDAIDLPEEE